MISLTTAADAEMDNPFGVLRQRSHTSAAVVVERAEHDHDIDDDVPRAHGLEEGDDFVATSEEKYVPVIEMVDRPFEWPLYVQDEQVLKIFVF